MRTLLVAGSAVLALLTSLLAWTSWTSVSSEEVAESPAPRPASPTFASSKEPSAKGLEAKEVVEEFDLAVVKSVDVRAETEDSADFVGDRPFKGKATYDVIGGGAGGGGGRYGSRSGGMAAEPDASRPAPKRAAVAEAGRLRAGETDDNARFDEYLAYVKTYAASDVHRVDVADRMILSFYRPDGTAVSNMPVEISAGGRPVARGVTTAAGKLLFAPKAEGLDAGLVAFTAEVAGRRAAFARGGCLDLTVDVPAVEREQVEIDLAFCLDTTGSMQDEIDAIKRTLRDVVARLDRLQPRPKPRYGMIQFRDKGDAYVTRETPFTPDLDAFLQALSDARAGGGGDAEEAVSEALCRSVDDLAWSAGDAIRVLFLVGDAAPHTNYADNYDYARAMRTAAGKGIKIFTLAASGLGAKGEYVWRQVAQFTQAKFIFITYGGQTSHQVGEYKENNLDELMLRAVTGEVEGLKARKPAAVPRGN